MHIERFALSGLDYLTEATHLLQRIRQDEKYTGVWEAADLQWWWRTPRGTDTAPQAFWADTNGQTVGAAVRTDWRGSVAVDVIAHPSLDATNIAELWSTALTLVADEPSVESMVEEGDHVARSHLIGAGLVDTRERGVSAWMDAPVAPTITPLPEGYRLTDRATTSQQTHHMADRNGEAVEIRLNETSLYRADLDLLVVDQSGAPAAYGLFWYDPATTIGFIEPMGTHEGHRRRGLANHVLCSGIERLMQCGATRLKINYESANEPASALYRGIGFRPTTTTVMYVTPG